MGNICGKQDPHDSPAARVPGSAAASRSRKSSSVPRVGGPARTLGGGGGSSSGENIADARAKAAQAAEARAKTSKQGGRLHSQLAAQKRQSRSETLKQASAEEQRAREIAHNEDSRTYN